MADTSHNSEPVSLWDCLHDGKVNQIVSDRMACSVATKIDTPFHWKFHKLPPETRFSIVGEGVRVVGSYDFEGWPGALPEKSDASWEEKEEQRRRAVEKARLVSASWNDLVALIDSDEDCLIMNASINVQPATSVLHLEIMSYPNSNYQEARIEADHFRYFVGDREPSLQEFGSAYWEDFASRAAQRRNSVVES